MVISRFECFEHENIEIYPDPSISSHTVYTDSVKYSTTECKSTAVLYDANTQHTQSVPMHGVLYDTAHTSNTVKVVRVQKSTMILYCSFTSSCWRVSFYLITTGKVN